mmetsp:Transcript_8492/g.16569  ORF Transcript_8492/g.16569 Transcript_8492/m.16569 type:complete len:234 (-) Transcript_8492:168-869(-)
MSLSRQPPPPIPIQPHQDFHLTLVGQQETHQLRLLACLPPVLPPRLLHLPTPLPPQPPLPTRPPPLLPRPIPPQPQVLPPQAPPHLPPPQHSPVDPQPLSAPELTGADGHQLRSSVTRGRMAIWSVQRARRAKPQALPGCNGVGVRKGLRRSQIFTGRGSAPSGRGGSRVSNSARPLRSVQSRAATVCTPWQLPRGCATAFPDLFSNSWREGLSASKEVSSECQVTQVHVTNV